MDARLTVRFNSVKLKIYTAGLTMAELAREGGFNRSIVMKTVDLKRFSPRVQDFICEKLGESGDSLWGMNYWRRRSA